MRTVNRRLTWQDVMHSATLLAATSVAPPKKPQSSAPAALLDVRMQGGYWLLSKRPRAELSAS